MIDWGGNGSADICPQAALVTSAGPRLLVGVVSVAAVGGAVTFHEVRRLPTGFTPADLLTQRTVGGAG